MLTLQRFKTTTVVFTALAILLISAMGAYAGSTYGNNEGVYWDLVTNSLYRYKNANGDHTYSTHQWFIENYSGAGVILIQQEFRHRILRVSDNQEMITKVNGDRTHTVTIPNTKSKRRVYRWKVDISSLSSGWYYIHAYTFIDIRGIDEDPEPEAHETSTGFLVE